MIRCPLYEDTTPENNYQRAFLIRRAFLFHLNSAKAEVHFNLFKNHARRYWV